METKIDQIIQQAKVMLNVGKLEEAKNLFQNILQIKPSHYKTHTNIGAILNKLGKLDEAEKCFKKAIKFKPDFVIAYYNLGITQEKLNKLNEAEKNYKKAIELNPNYAEAHNNLALILKKLNRYDESESNYKKAIEIKPDFAVAYYNLGVIQDTLFKFNEAELSYKKAIEIKPEYYEAEYNLNIILRQNQLLLKIKQEKSKKKININNIDSGNKLFSNPFKFKRSAEEGLLSTLYKINSQKLHVKANEGYLRYGNGRCSDFQLFENESKIIKAVSKDLIDIMKQAVKSEIYIIESFFNIFCAKSGITRHNHLTSFDKAHNLSNKKYSLTYYVSAGDKSSHEPGILKLYDPDEEILPSDGNIIIFPASRSHSAVYDGKTDRVMIGVNFYSLN
jgi:tetratricopeptide (TPR) repeat protein